MGVMAALFSMPSAKEKAAETFWPNMGHAFSRNPTPQSNLSGRRPSFGRGLGDLAGNGKRVFR
jgi:hypothetical protein